ncbi:MAG: hypothetical protein IPM46_14920 [Flavobacteriales bacterium]|nr:hypothetical protein [Flavobacteriales bacterium]
MPRIFNTIRQRLLKENRLTRYLIYAIGEIVLVVVGILIALRSIHGMSSARQLSRKRTTSNACCRRIDWISRP